jgi:hypothetical protein
MVGSGGTGWESGDTIGMARMNQKNVYCGYPAPSPTYAGMHWYDTTNDIWYVRSGDNNSWKIKIDQSLDTGASPTLIALNIVKASNYPELYLSYTSYQKASLLVGQAGVLLGYSGYLSIGRITGPQAAGFSETAHLDSSGILTVVGYVNSSPSITTANPWLGTPTTTRAVNTVYQNLTGKTIVVYIIIIITGGVAYESSYALLYLGSTSTPATMVGAFSNSLTINQDATLMCIVPNNWYYKLTIGNSVTLNHWIEQVL